ncbi:MAG TPA: DNA replication/repair protein RecF [Dokdonella sp.]|uniref:DNA replication/repair protein RecF n=1 Tax=Dokdonella sp. TaxID=2291710 RepID=UPI002B729D74|nr:DNA replication/repair protein RecF [Dokdonella sp.]HUD41897.1 DNA replication/repair protein RecF [Dokdonella sp.]
MGAGWNQFVGGNGAGKTTVLEAAYLLSHGRTFRSGGRDGLVRVGASGFSVFGLLEGIEGRPVRLGLARAAGRLEARVDGSMATLGELVGRSAIVCFEPGSHALIAGGAEHRRAYLDWGVFHVEQDFLGLWRRYQRALRQRNASLRAGAPDAELAVWELELATSGEAMTRLRRTYLERLRPALVAMADAFLGELGEFRVDFHAGWPAGQALADVLAEGRDRDRDRGHTRAGPHRADLGFGFAGAERREYFSRGQEKLCALVCILGQAQHYREDHGHWPIVCLDDLASELDDAHREAVIAVLSASDAQVLLTGTSTLTLPADASSRLFHVEQGTVRRLL